MVICLLCEDSGKLRYWDEGKPRYRDCPHVVQEREARKRSVLFDQSGLSPEMSKGMTFETWASPDLRCEKWIAACRKYAQEPAGFLTLIGPVGSEGKTHLASSIVVERLRMGEEAFFVEYPMLLGALQRHMTDDHDPFRDLYERLLTTRSVVALDDIGAEKASSWRGELTYALINHRANWDLPTVVTTNLELAQLDRAGSRLRLGKLLYA